MNCDRCKTEIVAQPTGALYVAKDGSSCTQVSGIHAPKVFRTHDEAARFSAAFRQSLECIRECGRMAVPGQDDCAECAAELVRQQEAETC